MPTKKRKLLDASTAAIRKAKADEPQTNSQQFIKVMPTEPMVTRAVKVQPAPLPPEPVVEVPPLAIEEALSDMLKVQYPTLMIKGVLGELAPKGDTIVAHGAVKEEEGSSSTPRKEAREDERATCEVQITEISTEQPEILPVEPQYQNPIMVEESALRGVEEALRKMQHLERK